MLLGVLMGRNRAWRGSIPHLLILHTNKNRIIFWNVQYWFTIKKLTTRAPGTFKLWPIGFNLQPTGECYTRLRRPLLRCAETLLVTYLVEYYTDT